VNWYKISLTEEEVSQGLLLQILHQFHALWLENQPPTDAALFAGRLSEKAESLFFSPAAIPFISDIIRRYDSEAVEPPDISNLVLLIGNADVRKRLSGEHE
jgi:hypothetical protein